MAWAGCNTGEFGFGTILYPLMFIVSPFFGLLAIVYTAFICLAVCDWTDDERIINELCYGRTK